jgi:hypothetical protein
MTFDRTAANRDAKGRLQICERASPLPPTTIRHPDADAGRAPLPPHPRRGTADRGEYRKAAGASAGVLKAPRDFAV